MNEGAAARSAQQLAGFVARIKALMNFAFHLLAQLRPHQRPARLEMPCIFDVVNTRRFNVDAVKSRFCKLGDILG